MPIRKKLGQLIKEKHWSVMGLAKSLNITKEHIIKWEKSNKRYKKYKRYIWYVQGNKDISLPDVQTLLFKKHLMKDKANPYLLMMK